MVTDSKRFEDLALRIMTVGVYIYSEAAPQGFEYRKGKTIEDAVKAVKRGRKNGMGKIEHEISFVALALKSVFKVPKTKD